MSNPVTNADIEDVLSSIRRLVSEDSRAPAPKPAPAGMDRLVLTPALRVTDNTLPEEVLSGAIDTDPVEDALSDRGDTIEPSEMPRPELVESHELAGVQIDDTGRRNLEARIAELEAVISDTGLHQWEPDGEEGSPNAGGPVESLAWGGDNAPVADPEESQTHLSDTFDFVHFKRSDDAAEGGAAADEPVEEAQIALDVEDDFEPEDYEPEALIEEIADEPEPEIAPEAPPTPAEEEIKEVHAETWDESEEAPEAYAGTDFLVDETMLRELVAEIVRQELQGSLGERITRNVRKLVRREILRALTSQELE